MTRLYEDVVEEIHHELVTGRRCDKCHAVHRFDPPPNFRELFRLQPPAVGWMRIGEEGTNRAWDFCAVCWPEVRAVLGSGGPL